MVFWLVGGFVLYVQYIDLEIIGGKIKIDFLFWYINGFIVVLVVFENWFLLNFIFDMGVEYIIFS